MALINNANQEGIKFYVSSVVDKQQRILLYFQLSAAEKCREPRQAPIFLPYASQPAESFMKVLLILMCSCLLFFASRCVPNSQRKKSRPRRARRGLALREKILCKISIYDCEPLKSLLSDYELFRAATQA